MCIVPLIILHHIAYFDLPECGPLPSSFSQGPMVADELINASVANYHRIIKFVGQIAIAMSNTTTYA